MQYLEWASQNPILAFVLCLVVCGILAATGEWILDLVTVFRK